MSEILGADDVPDLPESWQQGVQVDWGHTGPSNLRDFDDPAPIAGEVANRKDDVYLVATAAPVPRRETPEGNRQKARDFALARARQAQTLLLESVDWAGPESEAEATKMLDAVAGWVRTRHNKAQPKGETKTVFDIEQETGDKDAI